MTVCNLYPLAVHLHHISGSPSVGEGDGGGEGRDGSRGSLRAGLHSGVGGVLPGGAVHTLTEPLHSSFHGLHKGPSGIT